MPVVLQTARLNVNEAQTFQPRGVKAPITRNRLHRVSEVQSRWKICRRCRLNKSVQNKCGAYQNVPCKRVRGDYKTYVREREGVAQQATPAAWLFGHHGNVPKRRACAYP